ncbi:hypothetical protein STRTUCAR8_02448, partial [Streptomyces turgidiscabies Car8]
MAGGSGRRLRCAFSPPPPLPV